MNCNGVIAIPESNTTPHNWIAETSLELLYQHNSDNPFVARLRNNEDNMKMFYLLGTEAPDQSIASFFLTTRCNFHIDYFMEFIDDQKVFAGTHNMMRFEEGTAYPIISYSADYAWNMYKAAIGGFLARDCQRAAFFLGAMVHVIADATFYGHVMSGTRAQSFGRHVDWVTYKEWTERSPTDFFNTAEAETKISGDSGYMLDPSLATILAGMDTFFGGGYFGGTWFEDALFLLLYEPYPVDRQFWFDINGYWSGLEQELLWTYSDRPLIASDARTYFDTVEHNLNMGIYYSYAALNFAVTNGGYLGCDCLGDIYGRHPDDELDKTDRQAATIQVTMDRYMGLLFFNAVGLISTAIALTLIPKSLEKLLSGMIRV